MTKLSVNLNKVALLRNQRRQDHPDLLRAARAAIAAGAHGITVHPRQDERHIRPSDVAALTVALRSNRAGSELNVEGYPSESFIRLVHDNQPAQATLVPDAPDALTSDHGWDIPTHFDRLRSVIGELKSYGTRIALFVDADAEAASAAREVGADRIELFTGPYAAGYATGDRAAVLGRYVSAASTARRLGLGVNAGHDLTRENLPALFQAIPWIDEVSIGHYLTVDAFEMGFEAAVAAYAKIIGCAND